LATASQVKTHARAKNETGGGSGKVNNGFTPALILTFSPGEKEHRWRTYGFADECPANSVAGFQADGGCENPLLFEKHSDVSKTILFESHMLVVYHTC
jgi:hypothetical protein